MNSILAYIGAIVDGEGCICLKKINNRTNGKWYSLAISVTNTCKGLIDFLHKNFEGNLSEKEAKGNNRKAWRWELNSNEKVTDFLEKIMPYLLIKREQAELILRFAKQREGILNFARKERGYTEEQIEIYNELKRLKQEHPTELPLYNFTEEEKLYYLAGLIDGEGAIRITKAIHKNKYGNEKLILGPQITIGNTDKRLMEFLVKEFGGFSYEKKREPPWNSVYQWFMQGNDKKEFYERLRGKLLEKEDRLNLLLKYIESREKSYKITEEDINIFLELRKLNRKGKEEYDSKELLKYTEMKRSPRKFFIEKSELEDLYINKKLSIRQIAKMYNVQFESVRLRLKKEGIEVRTSKEGTNLNRGILTEEGKKAISEAVSKSKKEAWKNPEYREKMEKELIIARSKISRNSI